MLDNPYCPDGADCPLFGRCRDELHFETQEPIYEMEDICPLMDRHPEDLRPIDKQIKEW
jgi:hypothetical protein